MSLLEQINFFDQAFYGRLGISELKPGYVLEAPAYWLAIPDPNTKNTSELAVEDCSLDVKWKIVRKLLPELPAGKYPPDEYLSRAFSYRGIRDFEERERHLKESFEETVKKLCLPGNPIYLADKKLVVLDDRRMVSASPRRWYDRGSDEYREESDRSLVFRTGLCAEDEEGRLSWKPGDSIIGFSFGLALSSIREVPKLVALDTEYPVKPRVLAAISTENGPGFFG